MPRRLHMFVATLGGTLLVTGTLLGGAVAPVAAAGGTTSGTATTTAATTTTTAPTGPCATEWAAYKASESVTNGIALGDCMIGQRLTFLSKASTRVQDSKVLTSGDRAALATILSNDTSGLTSLKATLDAASTLPAVQADLHAIVSQYRVFHLAARQVALVSGADAVSTAVTHDAAVKTRLEARISAAAAKGRKTSAASAELAAMDRAVGRAASDVSGLSARVLALTPAEYDAGSAGRVLTHAATDVLQARAQLLDARADALRVLIRLR